jgi:hypothetical protein
LDPSGDGIGRASRSRSADRPTRSPTVSGDRPADPRRNPYRSSACPEAGGNAAISATPEDAGAAAPPGHPRRHRAGIDYSPHRRGHWHVRSIDRWALPPGSDAFAAIETVLPWDRFAAAVAEAKKLSREDGPDYAALAAANHAVLRRVGPLFLDGFGFEGVTGVGPLLRAIEVIRVFYAGSRRTLPKNMPIGFIPDVPPSLIRLFVFSPCGSIS